MGLNVCWVDYMGFIDLAAFKRVQLLTGSIFLCLLTNSNINEVIKTVLNFFFFLQKDFTSSKKHKTAYSELKLKNAYKKHLKRKKLLIRLLRFVLLLGCVFMLLVLLLLLMLLVRAKSFCKK